MTKIKAFIKRIKSYSKKEWSFDDYPTESWKNPNAGESNVAFGASIVNWSGMVGHGETPNKALTALKDSFKLYKGSNNELPRPGTKVPLKFASTSNIDKFENTAVDFFKNILNLNYYDGFYSDGSIFAYFEPPNSDEIASKKMKKEIIERTFSCYNVDITDIYDEPLWKIFERIKTKI